MSFIGSMLGAGQGSDWTTQQQQYNQGISTPVTQDQADQAYSQTQTGLQQQQSFLQALQAQNGIANQTASFNALQGVANGTGPNPAQAQLNQSTGANIANQAAMAAGQRGAGSNVGLIARQAGQQGGAIQQQAAGQSATMAAQQQLGAINSMGSLASTQVGQQAAATQGYNQAAQSEQQNLLNAMAQRNQSQASLAGSENAANANIQVQNSKAQQGIFGGLLGGAGSILAHGGEVGKDGYAKGGQVQNYAEGDMVAPAPVISGGSGGPKSNVGKFLYGSSPQTEGQQSGGGGLANLGSSSEPSKDLENGTSKFVGQALKNHIMPAIKDAFVSGPADPNGIGAQFSGQAPNLGVNTQLPGAQQPFTMTGPVANASAPSLGADTALPEADFAGLTPEAAAAGDAATAEGASAAEGAEGATAVEGAGAAEEGGGIEELAALFASGGKVPAMVSPGEVYLPPKKAQKVAAKGGNPIKEGHKIPGQAKVKGDSYANDTVPAKLEKGGIVIPRSVIQSDDPVGHAVRFVRAHLSSLPKKKK